MIVRISGKLVEKKDNSLVVEVHGVCYDVFVPTAVFQRVDETRDAQGHIHLVIYHYIQLSPSSGTPVLIGFINEVERDFFQQFIKVSGIGPRAAVKALDRPISEITRAIEAGDTKYLQTLPGIGLQRAKEIVAKLQGKVGRFGLIRDRVVSGEAEQEHAVSLWQEEALEVLTQLQYKKHEAEQMIQKALAQAKSIQTTEELLNEIYKQKVRH